MSARVAVAGDQHLTALHDAIQEAFGWADDHLYSFWLDGEFWGDPDTEYTRPDSDAEPGQHTADVAIDSLDLADGARIAYLFDFGDSWHVALTLRHRTESDGGVYPRVLERQGTAPPQYPDEDVGDE